MTDLQKQQVVAAMQQKVVQLKSQSAAANFLGISDATFSQILGGSYATKGGEKLKEIALKLGVKFGESWNLAKTSSLTELTKTFALAQSKRLFVAVSCAAGSGKSASARHFAENKNNVFYLQCDDWGKIDFCQKLAALVGINADKYARSASGELLGDVCAFFAQRGDCFLILDEADKLRDAALMTIIRIYNECEDRLSCAILGTEHLEKKVLRGVQLKKKGHAEILSRFGRRFIAPPFANFDDVAQICKANGVTSDAEIKKVWESCDAEKVLSGKNSSVVAKDLRRVKRAVQRIILMRKEQ
jgi:DNA transposition AAA+ family ATPase